MYVRGPRGAKVANGIFSGSTVDFETDYNGIFGIKTSLREKITENAVVRGWTCLLPWSPNSVGSDKRQSSDKSHRKNGVFRPFEHIFWFKFLIFGRSPPTPNFNGFTTKIPEMHVCAAHDCGRSWHVHRHPISASCSSRQSDKS